MKHKPPPHPSTHPQRRIVVALLTLALLLAAFCWLLVARVQQEMRADLFQQTLLVAQSLDVGDVKLLTGTAADAESPVYKRLKDQLVAIRMVNAQFRFVYLLGRRTDGALFFFVDSEPTGTEDSSPPGQTYDEATVQVRRVVQRASAEVVGPYTDRWGSWVSAFAPLKDARGQALIATLGVDQATSAWNRAVAKRAALPIGLALLLAVGISSVIIATGRNTHPRTTWSALGLLFVGLLVTLAASLYAKMMVEDVARNEFKFRCNEIQQQVKARLMACAQVLHSAAALFDASQEVERAEWRMFCRGQRVEENLPGVQGVGYAQLIRPGELEAHQAMVRGQGFPDYSLRPAGTRDIYSSIVYLEPFTGRNLRAFGYDMLSEPVRRAAMLHARDQNCEALSGKVRLVQETSEDVQAGSLMYYPIYRHGLPLETVEQRRAAILGWVYSPYRMTDLMRGTLGRLGVRNRVELQIFDGNLLMDAGLLFDSQGRDAPAGSDWDLVQLSPLDFAGHRWTLRFTQPGGLAAASDYYSVWFVLAGGTVISLLMFGLMLSLLGTRSRARRQAAVLTAELRESEESYRNQFLHNSTAMLLIDPQDGHLIDANEAAVAFYGYPREHLLRMRISEINTATSQEIQHAMATVVSAEGRHFEFQHRLADGSLRFVDVASSRIQFGERIVLHSIIHDVTARKQAENALSLVSERLALATKAAGVGVWDYDVADNRLIWDDQMYRLYGIVPGSYHLTYEDWLLHLHPEDRGSAHAEIQLALLGEQDFDSEFRVVWPDGSIHNIRALSMLQRDEQGHPLRMIGTNWDITDQKRSEVELQMANLGLAEASHRAKILATAAEQANASKGEFLANMSHEIRTPMNGVIGMTSLLLDSELDEEQRRHAQLVLSSAEGLLALLNDILDVSKMESGMLELARLDFGLRSLLDDVATTFAVRAHGQGLEFVCSVEPEVPDRWWGDPGRLRQILINLVSNAIKFTRQGEVEVRARLDAEDELAAVIRFTVRDTGPGIPSHKQSLLFNKFTQLDASFTRQFGGTGLGLAISKQLTELLGGQIGLVSEDGEGAEFWFTVRLEKQAEDAGGELAHGALQGVRVLVVDDNESQRAALRLQLEAFGMRVSEAADGAGTVDALRGARETGAGFQVALVDQLMPGVDGARLIQQIQADSDRAGLHLIQLVPLGAAGRGRQARESASVRRLAKPTRHDELLPCLLSVLTGAAEVQAAQTKEPELPGNIPLFDDSIRILLAEDNSVNQEVALGILKKLGLAADVVGNGFDAIRALTERPYDLVLMDAQMPEMDGFEATRQIRGPSSQVLDPRVPIVAMTAHAMPGDRERCLAAGMDDYLSKPILRPELFKVLERRLKRGIPAPDPEPAPVLESPVVDGSQLFDRAGLLARLLDDEDLVREVLQAFRLDMPRQLSALSQVIAAGDLVAAARQAHTVKGASANVGGNALSQAALELELLCAAGDPALVRLKLAGLTEEFRRLDDAIRLAIS